MEARTRFAPRGLIVGERTIPFYSGAMHYWRVPEKQWAPCLRAMHGLGLTLVETYVPWRVHEPERVASISDRSRASSPPRANRACTSCCDRARTSTPS